jgi:hypothetical protein
MKPCENRHDARHDRHSRVAPDCCPMARSYCHPQA